ncbi:type II secretion system protein GspG [Patescibacteria group bacterium]|nr:type II secretion system protein GspG [Patescibacteria group bacterium]
MEIKHNNNFQTKRAFTLIELLIVISIIGLLAGLSLFALAGSRESARDTTRKADLEKIRSGLEIYKADCNEYPSSLPAVNSPLNGSATYGCSPTNTNVYISSIPGDPLTGPYTYTPTCVGGLCISYTLSATLESDGTTYTVTNP